MREVNGRYWDDEESCLFIFTAVGTASRSPLLGRTALKKLEIVPVMVGLRAGGIVKATEGEFIVMKKTEECCTRKLADIKMDRCAGRPWACRRWNSLTVLAVSSWERI
jgi:hypothetical protein